MEILTTVTGTLPYEALVEDTFDGLKFSTSKLLWAGCIDAPDFIPRGGVRAVVIEGELEGLVCITTLRGK